MQFNRFISLSVPVLLAAGLILTACGGDGGSSNNNPASTSVAYRITVTNLTPNQPLSPAAIVFHRQGFQLWEIGAPASVALEILAESGEPAEVLTLADQDVNVMALDSGSGIIPPGSSEVAEVSFDTQADVHLTMVTMLANTNDAFAGVDGRAIAALALNESVTFTVPAYDAGTEANTEVAGTVPGPAANGEGFNPLRDDRDFVVIHPGVVSSQDGLAGSALDGSHRWDNPVLRITVERTG